MKSKTLVTGGTGLVGAHLLLELVKNDQNIVAIKRKSSNVNNVKEIFNFYENNGDELHEKINWVDCDLNDIVLLEELIKDCDYIFHCAGFVSFNNNFKDEMIEVNYVGTSNIIDLALKHKVKKICHVSSIATLGDSKNIDENSLWSWESRSGYAISKYLAENEVWRAFSEGMEGIIINPSVVIGPISGNSSFKKILKLIKKSNGFYTNGSFGYVDARDLAIIMNKLMSKKVSNERFIVNGGIISFKDLISTFSEKLKIPQPRYVLSALTIKIVLKFTNFFWRFINPNKITSYDSVRFLNNFCKLDNSKINNYLEIKFREINPSIDNCLKFYK